MFQGKKSSINTFFSDISKCPSTILVLYVLSLVCMNLLANKGFNFPQPKSWAIDGKPIFVSTAGILVSWISFLSMDILVKLFGPKISLKVSIYALIVNLICTFLFFFAGSIPGYWGESYNEFGDVINRAIDNTLKSNWQIVIGSSIAFLLSSLVNISINYNLGRVLKDNNINFNKFAIRSYISTIIGQFVDNIVFGVIVSYLLFGWTIPQVLGLGAVTALIELLFEIVFSPLGYFIVKKTHDEDEHIKDKHNGKLRRISNAK